MHEPAQMLGAAAIGALAGVISGMFGVGGGFLIVPLIVTLLGVPTHIAVGTALCATVANATGAFLRYRGAGAAELRFDWMLLGGSVVGASLGANAIDILRKQPPFRWGGIEVELAQFVLVLVYLIVFGSLAMLLFFKSLPERMVPPSPGPLARVHIPPLCKLPAAGLPAVSGPFVGAIGLCNGALSGFMGLGGGILLVPLMIYGFGFDMVRAAGTGVLVLLVTTVAGTVQHAALGHVDLTLAGAIMISSGLMTQVGFRITQLVPAKSTRKILAGVMLASAAVLLARLF